MDFEGECLATISGAYLGGDLGILSPAPLMSLFSPFPGLERPSCPGCPSCILAKFLGK